MNKIQEKSSCCRGSIWRRGERRRQCSICGKTWRSWKKKKGRKRQRLSFDRLFQYLKHENGSIRQQSAKLKLTPAGFAAQMANILTKFNHCTDWPSIPDVDLILIADAMIEYIEGIPHSFYFLLLRPINENKAIIGPCSWRINEGESRQGWSNAIQQLPPHIHKRIKVLVSDGIQSLINIGKENGWLIQRCQFHLQARISHYCSPRRFGKRPVYARKLQKLVNVILTSSNEILVKEILEEIQNVKNEISSRSFRMTFSGFLRNYEDFRTYLYYPHYHLPVTSNSAEFLIGQIRDLQYRARGFKSLKSLSSWIEAYCKYTKKITCNGKNYAPN